MPYSVSLCMSFIVTEGTHAERGGRGRVEARHGRAHEVVVRRGPMPGCEQHVEERRAVARERCGKCVGSLRPLCRLLEVHEK
jgi:hypothetical protein